MGGRRGEEEAGLAGMVASALPLRRPRGRTEDRRRAWRGGSRKPYFFQSHTAGVRAEERHCPPACVLRLRPSTSEPAAGEHCLSGRGRRPILTGMSPVTGLTELSGEVLLLLTPWKEATALLITEGVSYCEVEMQFISGK